MLCTDPCGSPSKEASDLLLRVLQLQVGYKEGGAGGGAQGRGLRGARSRGRTVCGLAGERGRQ